MLPFRLRPPLWGPKYRKERKQELKDQLKQAKIAKAKAKAASKNGNGNTTNASDTTIAPIVAGIPWRDGGPLQKAVADDLLELRAVFVQQLLVQQQQQQQISEAGDLNQTTTATTTATPLQEHDKEGTAFSAFRAVFSNAKTALLHTRLAPPRAIDQGQYSQMIYSACLSLMEEALLVQTSNTDHDDYDTTEENNVGTSSLLQNAAYGLFCLYTLYETNPLPRITHETTDQERLELCSMGLLSVENPKSLFRRSFRGPIRIGRHAYSMMLQLREHAMVVQAQCRTSRLQACKKELKSRMGGGMGIVTDTDTVAAAAGETEATPAALDFAGAIAAAVGTAIAETEDTSASAHQHTWHCQCGMAVDTIRVIDRIMPDLDYCEYDGPCSVEGLAGHADYPYPCVKPNPQQQQAMKERKIAKYQSGRIAEYWFLGMLNEDDDNDERIAAEAYTPPESILTDLQGYQAGLRALRIPVDLTKQKTKRFQDALAPVLRSKGAGVEMEVKMTAALGIDANDNIKLQQTSTFAPSTAARAMTRRQLRSQRVTWAEAEADDASSVEDAGAGAQQPKQMSAVPNNNGIIQQDFTYELVLPDELPSTLQEGIQSALEHILDRDQPVFLPTDGKRKLVTPGEEDQQDQHNDDMSSIGIGGVSLAQSSVTGGGRAALDNLLAKENQSHRRNDEDIPRARDRVPMGRAATTRPPQHDFLLMSEEEESDYEGDNSDQSDSDDDSDTSKLSTSDVEDEEEDDHDAMSVATSAVGQRALAALLSFVSEKKGTGRARKSKKKATKVKGNKSTSGRRKPNKNNGATSNRSIEEQSVASSRTGQGKKALDALLGLAGDGADSASASDDSSQSGGDRSQYDGGGMDDLSVAASSMGPGQAAMKALFAGINEPKRTAKRVLANPKATQQPDSDNEMNRLSMTASSVGAGQAAMEALFAGINEPKRTATRAPKRVPAKPKATQQADSDNEMDGLSMAASSVGAGQAAMEALFAGVAQPKPTEKRVASRARQPINMKAPIRKPKLTTDPSSDEEVDSHSLAESSVGQGGAAMAALLAGVAQPKPTGKRVAWGKQPISKKAPVRKPKLTTDPSSDEEGDNHSIAESSVGQGGAAMVVLLAGVAQPEPTGKRVAWGKQPISKKAPVRKPKATIEPGSDEESDNHSIAESSVGAGQAAMEALFAGVAQPKPTGRRVAARARQPITKKAPVRKPKTTTDTSSNEEVDSHSIAEGSVGAGQAAMEALLGQAGKGQPKKREVRQPSKRKSPLRSILKVKQNPSSDKESDGHSLAESSIGQGRAVVETLLVDEAPRKMRATVKRNQPTGMTKKPVRKTMVIQQNNNKYSVRKPASQNDAGDDHSLAERSIGHGQAAMEKLLGQIAEEQPTSETGTGLQQERKLQSRKPSGQNDIDDSSVAERFLGQGQSAMETLLARVSEEEPKRITRTGQQSKKPGAAKKTRTTPAKAKELPAKPISENEIDDFSIAESSVGQGQSAMEALLAKVDDQPNMKRRARQQSEDAPDHDDVASKSRSKRMKPNTT